VCVCGCKGDGYNRTGCSDLNCPGFVQVNRGFVLGAPLKRISSYNAAQFSIGISIYEVNARAYFLLLNYYL
jgi:hypothetical protein